MTGSDRAAGVVAGMVAGAANRVGGHIPIGDKGFSAGQVATPFSGVLKEIMEQTQTLGKQASDAVTGLLSGQGVEIHDVMIAQQKADAAFELALQVRNKAVSAYQQLMGMQF